MESVIDAALAAYRRGFVQLLAPPIRKRGTEVLSAVAATLRNWLLAQLPAMAVVGVLTGAGLSIAGIPLAFALGLMAGLLAFIPNLTRSSPSRRHCCWRCRKARPPS